MVSTLSREADTVTSSDSGATCSTTSTIAGVPGSGIHGKARFAECGSAHDEEVAAGNGGRQAEAALVVAAGGRNDGQLRRRQRDLGSRDGDAGAVANLALDGFGGCASGAKPHRTPRNTESRRLAGIIAGM